MNLGTGYYDYFVPDITDVNKIRDLGTLRNKWFSRFLTKYENFDLIFFDPDNGIEVKSSKFGTKGSYKYLYLHEIDEIWKRKQNILIYQHRNRQKMNDFLKGKYCLLKKYGMPLTFCAGTGVVFFLLLQQPTLVNTIKRAFNDKKYAPEYLSLLN